MGEPLTFCLALKYRCLCYVPDRIATASLKLNTKDRSILCVVFILLSTLFFILDASHTVPMPIVYARDPGAVDHANTLTYLRYYYRCVARRWLHVTESLFCGVWFCRLVKKPKQIYRRWRTSYASEIRFKKSLRKSAPASSRRVLEKTCRPNERLVFACISKVVKA